MTERANARESIDSEWGAFDLDALELATWVREGLGDEWKRRESPLTLIEARELVVASERVSRYLCVPFGSWSALFTNGPRGTDVGLFPSYAARELGRRAIRIVDNNEGGESAARILDIYGPDGSPPLFSRRSIALANDGGRWVFEQTGAPFEFEDVAAYARRPLTARFSSAMLWRYVEALGVPNAPLVWSRAHLVELL